MASKAVTGSNGHHTFTMTVTERSGSASTATNTSIVDFSIVLSPAQSGYDWTFQNSDPFTLTYTINGVSGSCTLRTYNGTSTVTLKTGNQTVTHNSDGSKSINWSFSFTSQNYSYLPGSGSSGTQTLTLSTIPRYPTVSHAVGSKTETTITMNWSSDKVIDRVWYSTNGGSSWSSPISANAKSGSYTISGLSANTTYSIVTSLRSKESQLYKNSSAMNVATYNYPYCNSAPNFNIGSEFSIGLYNPLGRAVTVTMFADDGSEKAVGSAQSGTKVTGFYSDAWQEFWYKSIKNSTSGTYSVKITYSGHASTGVGGTYRTVASLCTPTVGTITYVDTNSTTTGITGDSSKIVQTKSTVMYTVSGVSAKNYASISSVKVEVNGNTYTLSLSGSNYVGGGATINSASNVTAKVTVTDSRGYTKSANKTITMLPWAVPSAVYTVKRHNNYYSETDIKVDPRYSDLNGNNSVTIKYRYKQNISSASWTNYIPISANTIDTFTIDNSKEWIVEIVVTDALNGTVTYSKIVSKGTPLIYFDRLRTSVGVNCLPESNEALWVNGYEVDAKNLLKWGSLDQYESLTPVETHETGFGHSQGMACDGDNIYITTRDSYSNLEPMKIVKLRLSDWTTVSTHTMTTGHYNSLYWYENRLYSAGASMSGNDNADIDYSNVRVINSNWTTDLVSSPLCWGVGVRKFEGKGYITAIWRASSRDILFYDSYYEDNAKKQTPLTRTTLDFTGSTTIQGTFHLTDDYIWTLETAYSAETRASGHQVIRCFSYSGMLVKAFYLDSITDELQDLWVDDDNEILFVNDRSGRVYKFELPHLYHTIASSIAVPHALKQGMIKHVYKHPSNLDTGGTFVDGNNANTYTVTSKILLSDYTFLNEIGEFFAPTLWVNNIPSKGHVTEGLGSIYFEGTYFWSGASEMQWSMRFSKGSDSTNYYYYLSRLTVRGRDPNTTPDPTRFTYNVTSNDGGLSSGDLKNAFTYLYQNGWLFSDIYIDGMSYVIGMPSSSTDLGIL